ncbi:uncharacterized protein FYW23_015843 [Sylvia borin]
MAELQRTPAAGVAPPRKVYVLEEPPSVSRGSAPSLRRPRVEPEREILRENREFGEFGGFRGSDPGGRSRRWWILLLLLVVVLVVLVLSGVWAALHRESASSQQELREELQRLRETSAGNWTEAWQTLEHVQWQQMELSRMTALLCQAIEDSRKCPPGWQFYHSSCYYFSSLSRAWADARSFCRAFDADLVVVSTEDEQLFLVRNIQSNNTYWMGVTDKQHKGKWIWVTGRSPTFGFWDVWEEDPDREHKDCGAMRGNGRWVNERCSEGRRWICERSWDCDFSSLFPLPDIFSPDE